MGNPTWDTDWWRHPMSDRERRLTRLSVAECLVLAYLQDWPGPLPALRALDRDIAARFGRSERWARGSRLKLQRRGVVVTPGQRFGQVGVSDLLMTDYDALMREPPSRKRRVWK